MIKYNFIEFIRGLCITSILLLCLFFNIKAFLLLLIIFFALGFVYVLDKFKNKRNEKDKI